jgi:error-prone DNA polymerase
MNSLPMGFYSVSQIVQDAKQHDIKIFPCCVSFSQYDHQIVLEQGRYAIRLGLRLIKGLKRSSAISIVEHRQSKPFISIHSVRRLNLPSTCMQALASADAFACFVSNRFDARWQLMDDTDALPLFIQEPTADQSNTYIRQPSLFDSLVEDYASTGLSVSQHPIGMLANANLLPKFTPAAQLHKLSHKSLVQVIGLVTCKQSPGTASGVTFITLEDHTGNTNVIIWQNSARAQKQAYLNAKILQVNGILERGDGDVIHVIAGRLIDQTRLLGKLDLSCREFK